MRPIGKTKWYLLLLAMVGIVTPSLAQALTLNVVGPDGTPIAGGYRWLVEEDATKESIPGSPAVPGQNYSVAFHTSYMPVVAKGDETTPPTSLALDPNKRYFVSVLPKSGYTIGAAPFRGGDTAVSVLVNTLPLPTAQISVFVFQDNQPINNAPDLPEETGLAGFKLIVTDAGGTYGASGGQMSQDAFGNPLGTSYRACGAGETPPCVAMMGSGAITTNADGLALIQNLAPGKYTIEAVPPAGQGWIQTATIEGTKGIDAWVKANEPSFFVEFGPPGYHVFIGFVKPTNDATVLKGGSTISGQVVNLHNSRPPDFTFYNGEPVSGAWVGLNDLGAGAGRGVFAAPCNPETGEFSIPNVPPGNYQLVVWDENLDVIFALLGVTVNPDGSCNTANGSCNLLEVPVFNWFARLDTTVFADMNQNGFRDPDEMGIPEVPVNIRFRDGSIYQSFPTDGEGNVPFSEVFPFFNWLVAEVDYGRLKATGTTVVVDAGGAVNPDQGWAYPSRDKLTPQPQYCTAADVASDYLGCAALGLGAAITNPNTGNNLSKTETGPVLLQAIQTFLGQTNVIEFGKAPYGPGENGGITGMAVYAITRAENNPRDAVADNWEPGIPRVQVNLYEDMNRDGIIDDKNADGCTTLADVDNYPFGWSDGTAPKGAEDIDHPLLDAACQPVAGTENSLFDLGDAIDVTTTDSWDDSVPTGCQGEAFAAHGVPTDCFDGLRNFNQVRPGVFDGGFAFGTPAGKPTIPKGTYIVEAVAPPGYEHVKEEDKNVDFGDSYTPKTMLVPVPCVGDPHVLQPELALFPGVPNPLYDPSNPGKTTPLCDRKQVAVSDGLNAAANFFLFTEVPVAAHIVGFILDDTANEFDPTAPNFGEKYAPPWLPVSVRDWTGREINRVYSDEWGSYNALAPSTYTVNVPDPSGISPNMLTTCMNDPGPILDRRTDSPTFGQMIEDPYFNRQYSQFCYTFQYIPGKTTYLDTPVVPVAAFAGPGQFPLDCDFTNGTPGIFSVSGPTGGPYVSVANNTQLLTITSLGEVAVPNPEYDGPNGTKPKTIMRDFGFGPDVLVNGVRQGKVTINGVPLTITTWTNGTISARVPSGVATGELAVIRGDNSKTTTVGVTVTVGGTPPLQVAPGSKIQPVIDAAPAGSLVLVPPGTYNELVVMWKPIRLQGWGAGSTFINAAKSPAEKVQQWRDKVQGIVASGAVDLLPGQPTGAGFPEPALLGTEEGPGVIVLSRNRNTNQGGFGLVGGRPNARIDGVTISGGDTGGGIFVNGYARYLEIANNRIVSNNGTYGGGIRIGHPLLTVETNQGIVYADGDNDNISIHNNQIAQNGGLGAAGGGITLSTGTDGYGITGNFICGNFSMGDGGGIGHLGRSNNGVIQDNAILFNQSFNQGQGVSGGGIVIAGAPGLAGPGSLSPGSGTVTINRNLIQGNLSGAGDGGGIRTQFVNGLDVSGTANQPANWFGVNIFNNMIVNNVAGLAGGAISMQDTVKINIVNNTIANNDSTATAGEAFTPGNPDLSNPQPAGVVARAHTTALYNAIGNSVPARPYKVLFSNPDLRNNIIWHNRSFYFTVDNTVDPPFYGLFPDLTQPGAQPVYSDLAVLGTPTPASLNPRFCLLTNTAGYPPANSNISAPPMFMAEYLNGARNMIQQAEIVTAIQAQPAFDEGGNFIDVRFGPLTQTKPDGSLFGNYHLMAGSPAVDTGTNTVPLSSLLQFDFDRDPRPLDGDGNGSAIADRGADEYKPLP